MLHKQGNGFNLTVNPYGGPSPGECAGPKEARRIQMLKQLSDPGGLCRGIPIRTCGQAGEEGTGDRVQRFGDGGKGLAGVNDTPLGYGKALQTKTGLFAIHEERWECSGLPGMF